MSEQQAPTPDKRPAARQVIAHELRRFLNSQKTMVIASGIVVLALAGTVFGFMQGQTPKDDETTVANSTAKNEPEYTTLLPEATSIKQLGGWVRVSPPGSSAVYAFQDSIKNTDVSVTQQPLPEAFKSDPQNKLADFAKSYSATTKLKADKTVFYVGTSAKGPQSVLFIKDDVLVLIKSDKKLTNKDWIGYITLLKDPKRSTIPKY